MKGVRFITYSFSCFYRGTSVNPFLKIQYYHCPIWVCDYIADKNEYKMKNLSLISSKDDIEFLFYISDYAREIKKARAFGPGLIIFKDFN